MKRKKLMEKGMQGVFFISALASIIAVALICIFMFARGVPAIAEIGPCCWNLVMLIFVQIWR